MCLQYFFSQGKTIVFYFYKFPGIVDMKNELSVFYILWDFQSVICNFTDFINSFFSGRFFFMGRFTLASRF